jgi:hypothetical protein
VQQRCAVQPLLRGWACSWAPGMHWLMPPDT